jgi:UDP-glucose 4-epimerase
VKAFEKVTGVALNYAFADRRPGDVEAVWAAATEPSRLPGWVPTHSLEDAMRDAWHWQQMLASNPL